MLSAKQTGKDGEGKEKIINGSGVRLKAKEISTTKSTKLTVTGLNTGATWTMDVVVRPGGRVYFTPPAEEYSPPLPVANFSFVMV